MKYDILILGGGEAPEGLEQYTGYGTKATLKLGARLMIEYVVDALRDAPGATPKQKVISEIMSGVERVRIDTEKNFLDVLDKVHEISAATVDQTHVFPLSQVYEGLLLKMGEKGNDGGQFFTPREIIRAMVRVVDPGVGETVYDPGCGTGGFLAQSYEYMLEKLGAKAAADNIDTLVRQVSQAARGGDHILCMSNGSFSGVHARLLQALQSK